ncbi:MAG: FtsX-like permease family protein [Dermatophilaceae bacterium]
MRSVLVASLRMHTRRYVAAVVAIVVGVGFIMVTASLTSATREGLLDAVGVPYEGAAVVATGVSATQAAALRDGAADAGARASVLGFARVPASGANTRLAGEVDVAEQPVDPALRWQELTSGRFAERAGEAVVDGNAAPGGGIEIGDRARLGSGPSATEVTVVGLVDSPSVLVSATFYLTWSDLSVFESSLYVDSVAWAGRGDAAAQIGAVRALVPDATAQPVDDFLLDRQEEANNGVDVIAVLLLVFAAVALVVSVLVVANTFSVLFAQRRRDLALLRCVGATRRQVLRSIRMETFAIGLGASALGIVAGLATGSGVVALALRLWPSATLGTPSVGWPWYVGAFTVGLVVTGVAAWLPTRAATRVEPLAALRPEESTAVHMGAGRWRIALGVLAVAAGSGLLAASVSASSVAVMIAGGAVGFAGVALLGPLVVPAGIRGLGWLVARWWGAPGRLAVGNAVRHPRRTAATAISLLVGVTLTVAMLTGLTSSTSAVNEEMAARHPVDLAVSSTGEPIQDDVARRLAAVPGVSRSVAVEGTRAEVEGVGALTVVGAGAGTASVLRTGTEPEVGPGEIAVPHEALDEPAVGDTVTVSTGGTSIRLRPVGVDGYGGTALVALGTLTTLDPDPAVMAVWLRADDGADPEELGGAIGAVLPTGEVENGLANRAWVDLQLEAVTATVVTLLAVAVLIALVGIGSTLGLSVLERRREIALLRALGLTRRQLRTTLAMESVLLSVTVTLLGGLIGVTFAWVAVEAVVRPVLDAPLVLPVGRLLLVVLVAGLAGLAAGVLPARRAARVAPAAGLALE